MNDVLTDEEKDGERAVPAHLIPNIDQKEVTDAVKNIKVEKTEIKKETDDLFKEFSTFITKAADLEVQQVEKTLIPSGIDLLDAILGGGFPAGALNIIVGTPGCGKSMLAAQVLANAQRLYSPLLTGFLDSEEATTTIRLANLGVKNPMVKPYSDITVEKVFKFLEGMCIFKEEKKMIEKPSMVIWDSIANTLTEKERQAEDPKEVIGFKARMLSILIPRYIAKMSQYNICMIAVNQLRDVIDMGQFSTPADLKFMSASKNMPGGQILRYNAFHLIEMRVKSAFSSERNTAKYGFDGVLVVAKCVKNKLFPPNVEIGLVGDFVRGFDNFYTNYNFLVDTKRMKTGAWNYLIDQPDLKFRTKDAKEMYTNPKDDKEKKFKEGFDTAVAEAIQKDIVEKYNPVI